MIKSVCDTCRNWSQCCTILSLLPRDNQGVTKLYYSATIISSFCMILIYTAVSPGIVNSMTASPTESARTKSRSASPDENVIISTTAASLPVASSSNTRTKKKRGRRGTTSKRERVE